ncbi:MAG: ethanolamine ammonia-lyase subunit EutC [Sulfurospirillaceae bacterium]|nr:ethanolamine ammonia-lyase subunit EutC [Sulfurospirillaceae bacterium]
MNDIQKTQTNQNIIENPWAELRKYTDARIGLGRAGVSIPTSHMLDFTLAHAKAQDAVHEPLDVQEIVTQLQGDDLAAPLLLHSQAIDRDTYLKRPDLGRRLDVLSCEKLQEFQKHHDDSYDLSIVIADGLSSIAIKNHAANFIKLLKSALAKDSQDWKLAPLMIVQQGRVAIADEIGAILGARTTLILIGERPGLSSPDSLGLYLTWNPKVGTTDAGRNCISNVRHEGLSYEKAVQKAMYLLKESRRLQLSGVNLKDRTFENVLDETTHQDKLT